MKFQLTPTELADIQILGPRVLLKRESLPERTEGGLWLVGREWPAIATVLKIGFIRDKTKLLARIRTAWEDLRIGDLVTFSRYEFEKWEVAPEHAIMPIDRLELRIRD